MKTETSISSRIRDGEVKVHGEPAQDYKEQWNVSKRLGDEQIVLLGTEKY
jgi:hypothetical protein